MVSSAKRVEVAEQPIGQRLHRGSVVGSQHLGDPVEGVQSPIRVGLLDEPVGVLAHVVEISTDLLCGVGCSPHDAGLHVPRKHEVGNPGLFHGLGELLGNLKEACVGGYDLRFGHDFSHGSVLEHIEGVWAHRHVEELFTNDDAGYAPLRARPSGAARRSAVFISAGQSFDKVCEGP